MAVKELSADELRERLFHTFRNRGVLDSLKATLRNQLVTELEQTAKLSLSKSKKVQPQESSLLHRAVNSLVAEHLEVCNYEYTLSVFLPESGLSRDKLLSIQDILHLLNIGPESQLYHSLECDVIKRHNTKGFLWNFICGIAGSCGHGKSNASVQTDETTDIHKSSLDEKLSHVEKMYNNQVEKEKEAWSIHAEQQILAYQRQCEQRKKEEIEVEMKRFCSMELARMRLEEREKCQKEIKQTQDMLEKDYAMKAEVLRVREKETLARLERERQMQESEAYDQRQKILEEMQSLKGRENELKQRHELNMKAVQLDEEKAKAAEEKLKLKEAALAATQKRYEQKLKDEIQRYKLQCQEEFQKRHHNLELREAQLRQDQENFDKTKTIHLRQFDQLEEKKEKVIQLQAQLDNQKYTLATVMQQKEHLAEKVYEMKDYRAIRDNELMFKNEVESLRSKLAEQKKNQDDAQRNYQEKIKELQHQLAKPPAEWLALKEELMNLNEDAKRKQKEFREQLRKQDLKLRSECQQSNEYQRRYEEQVILKKELQRETADLRMALRHTQNALNTELQRRKITEPELSETFLRSSLVASPPCSEPSTCTRPRVDSERSEGNSTMELLANSKAVFDRLEREAKGLEESYINFQSRMRNTGLSFNDPRAVLVPCEEPGTSLPGNGTETQHEFVPLTWVPGSPDKPSRDECAAQVYTLPSFGISQLPQDAQTRYLATTISSTMPTNHSVSVSDLEARPGQPSVIAAPIKGTPITGAQSTLDIAQDSRHVLTMHPKGSGISHQSSNSSRRPLSSTIDPSKGDSQNTTQETNIPMTSHPLGSNVRQIGNARVQFQTSLDSNKDEEVGLSRGNIYGDATDSECKSGSDLSLSSGMLTTGVLKTSAAGHEKTVSGEQAPRTTTNTNRERTKTRGFGVIQPRDGQMSNISLDVDWRNKSETTLSRDFTDASLGSRGSAVGGTVDSGGGRMVSLDDAWKVSSGTETQRSKPDRDQELRDKDGGELMVSLDDAWKVSSGTETLHKVHRDKPDGEQELRDKEERDWRIREMREQEIQEREEREWKAEQKRQEEARRRREQEAWEREQRELRELERLERDERERENRERDRASHEQNEITLEEEDIEDAVEDAVEDGKDKNENGNVGNTEPDIDPVMLQYMNMIKKRKEQEERKVPETEDSARYRAGSKEVVPSLSNSEVSQGDQDLGSIAGLSDNDGFDWG